MAVEKVLYNYYLIIPLLTELASDRVISVLVKRGYVVSSLSVTEKVCLTEENNVVAILSLNIKKSLPSNTKDLMGFLIRWLIALARCMGQGRLSNLFHQTGVLQNKQRFLLAFPIIRADDDKVFTGPAGYLQWQMLANDLFYEVFQVVPKLVDADYIHRSILNRTVLPYIIFPQPQQRN